MTNDLEPELLAMLTEEEQEWLEVAVTSRLSVMPHELLRSLAEARQTVELMRREGCAAIGTLERIFTGLTSPNALKDGISAELAARMGGAAAATLAGAERCEHKAERAAPALLAALEGLGPVIALLTAEQLADFVPQLEAAEAAIAAVKGEA